MTDQARERPRDTAPGSTRRRSGLSADGETVLTGEPPWGACAWRSVSGGAGTQELVSPDSSSEATASKCSSVAGRSSSHPPTSATMAALSAHKRGEGPRRATPRPSHSASSRARSAQLHATPPPRLSARAPVALSARAVLATRVSRIAAWNEEATSAVHRRSYGGSPRASTASATAVLSPENEKSKLGSVSIGRGNEYAVGFPSRAMDSIAGPPGKGRPSRLATLSNASPAASSRVLPSH